ncbi:MAG: hypothetical protein AAGF45_06115 [Pseudomonadota bacterium]
MQKTFGALAAIAIVGTLLVGPLFMAVTAADDRFEMRTYCANTIGCDGKH